MTHSKTIHGSCLLSSTSAFVVGVLHCLSGCTVGPDFDRPHVQVPAGYSLTEVDDKSRISTVTTGPLGEAAWWKAFGDETLSSLVRRAVEANLDVKAAESRLREARASRGVVAAEAWPVVGANASAQRSRSPNQAGGGKTGNFFRVGIDATWELDVFGGTRRAVEAADADIQAAVEDRRGVIVTLAAEVALNYTDLRGFQQQLNVAKRNLTLQRRSLEITRGQRAGGIANSLDVANAEAQVASTESSIPSFEASCRQSIYALSVLLALEPASLESELSEAGAIPPVPPVVPAGLPSELLERRPDIRMGEARIHAATARVGVATADLFPKFSLTGSVGFQSDQLQSLLSASNRAISVGPSVNWPLFEGGRLKANVAVNEARVEQELIAYRKSVLVALSEVQSSLIAYAKEQERREALVRAVDASRRAADYSQRLYAEGQTEFLNVLTAQRTLLQSEDALTQSTRTLSTTLVSLYKALGGGWEPSEAGGSSESAEPPRH